MQNIHFCFIISSIVLVEIKSFVLQLLTCVFLFLFFFFLVHGKCRSLR